MISAGKKSEVVWGDGNWIFLDIGFSSNGRTCGYASGDEDPQNLTYADARKAVIEKLREQNGFISLVIEAPLSVCFDSKGNPKGRRIERRGSKTRYWYSGLGCSVLTAAMYLIRDIQKETEGLPHIRVRLFEGFVSFKDAGTDHAEDVSDLRRIVKNALQHQDSICSSEELKFCEDDDLYSAFRVAGLDCGVPAVIIAKPSTLTHLNISLP
jgi:hypothetical protein